MKQKLECLGYNIAAFFLVLYACLVFWICRLAGIHIEEDF